MTDLNPQLGSGLPSKHSYPPGSYVADELVRSYAVKHRFSVLGMVGRRYIELGSQPDEKTCRRSFATMKEEYLRPFPKPMGQCIKKRGYSLYGTNWFFAQLSSYLENHLSRNPSLPEGPSKLNFRSVAETDDFFSNGVRQEFAGVVGLSEALCSAYSISMRPTPEGLDDAISVVVQKGHQRGLLMIIKGLLPLLEEDCALK